jgi:hypothetical protein
MNPPTAIGLDIGTSRLVTATGTNTEPIFQSQLNAFLALPFSRLTEMALRRERIAHEAQKENLIILGNDSDRLANLFHLETRRPMIRGLLNPNESGGSSIMRQLLTTLLGQNGEGRRVCFSVPGAPSNAPHELTYHEATIRGILTEMGFQASTINEGLAVVLAELEDTNFTGLGVTFGGGMCNVCLAYLSMPVFSFSVSKGGDFIDESAAGVAGEGATRVRAIKEHSFYFNGFYADQVKQALTIYYDDVIGSVINALAEYLSKPRNVPRLDRAVPVVISGGTSLPRGFKDRFEALLKVAELPLAISEIRTAADPLNSTAKGALVAALAEI